jgi:hypothetical protein
MVQTVLSLSLSLSMYILSLFTLSLGGMCDVCISVCVWGGGVHILSQYIYRER